VSERLTIQSYFKPLSQVLDVGDPVWKAWRIMKEYQTKHLPVLKDEKIIGIVSDRDIVQISGYNGGQSMPVKDAMSLDPLILMVTSTMDEALHAMLQKEQHHAIVVNTNKSPCGLFSWDGAFQWFLETAQRNPFKFPVSN